MTTSRTVVIGGGVAGCAVARAVAMAGGTCVLIETLRHLGGVAVQGEHRSLCGLAALDAQQPHLLEPELVGPWMPLLTTGAAVRQGRVWLWPTDASRMQSGLLTGLRQSGVELRLGSRVVGIERAVGHAGEQVVTIQDPQGSTHALSCAQVVDASGSGLIATFLGLPRRRAQQWASARAVVRVDLLPTSRAQRVRLLRTMQQALHHQAALALTPIAEGRWQLSLDVPSESVPEHFEPLLQRAAAAIDGEILAVTRTLAERDQGRPSGSLTLETLFACRERGLCWASWPREEHTAHGVEWTYPDQATYGVPESAVRLPSAPAGFWFVGKSMPVEAAAAAALRVTGTCLAVGAAVGRRCMGDGT